MKKSEMINILIDRICEECEVSRSCLIGGSRLQAVVDARLLLVQYGRRIGLSSDDIALIQMRFKCGDMSYMPAIEEVKKKAKNVDRLFNAYSSRCMQSYAFCLMSRSIRDFCREQYKGLYMVGMKELPE